mmetsp:Transcript_21879/g.35409  ORF Transcript_21879/g.35409 Transcript_21879/m.35409 type:complete len:96 (-) Transcript_21879:537-824(-)
MLHVCHDFGVDKNVLQPAITLVAGGMQRSVSRLARSVCSGLTTTAADLLHLALLACTSGNAAAEREMNFLFTGKEQCFCVWYCCVTHTRDECFAC